MANQKKTLLVFTSVDADVLRNGSAASLEKLRQKGALGSADRGKGISGRKPGRAPLPAR